MLRFAPNFRLLPSRTRCPPNFNLPTRSKLRLIDYPAVDETYKPKRYIQIPLRMTRYHLYLLHFVHEDLAIRWTEFQALARRHGCNFDLVSDPEHIQIRPYIMIRLRDCDTPDHHEEQKSRLVSAAKGSYLLKGLFELWSGPSQSLDDLVKDVLATDYVRKTPFTDPNEAFRVDVESYGLKVPQTKKVEWIKSLKFMEDIAAKPNLKNPKQYYCLFEYNEPPERPTFKEYYFGRRVCTSARDSITKFSLKTRKFIANTSMDPMLSFIMSNIACVKPNDVVYDPFVGSGSLLIAAAHLGAYVHGSDIDWQLLHGKSRPSRKGDKQRADDECVRINFKQYDMSDAYLDVLVSDVSRRPFRQDFKFDAIVTDPPYGVRECSEKIGSKSGKFTNREKEQTNVISYPSKTCYNIVDLLNDLLNLSANHLTIGGRLVYFLPVIKEMNIYDVIPEHPCLQLVSACAQALSSKTSRILIVMEKVRDCKREDIARVPEILANMNFRESYFNKSVAAT